jgi:RHS repeat-associated protein
LNALDATQPHPLTYTPYGHRPAENGLLSLLGFNGERPDPVTGHYLLGNGYRAFNPVLMRFNSPDSWSPFGEGGLNAYAYCQGDPTNRVDPTGHYYTPVTKAIADFKQAKLGISKASIIISKAENNKAARPLSPPKTLSKSEKYKQYHREYSRTKRNDLRELTNLIKKNEAALKNENKQYMITKNITDLEQSTKGYELAKDRYNFKKYPDPNIEHPWEDPDGNTILDPSHFDIAISHFRNITREKRKHPELTGNSDTVRRLIILRAVYIKNFTGNDLMRIRQ